MERVSQSRGSTKLDLGSEFFDDCRSHQVGR